jgi:Flp pilus assembly pilin Flp
VTWRRECIRCAYTGQAHFEYALILAVMALVVAVSLSGMAAHLNNTLIAIANSLPHTGG